MILICGGLLGLVAVAFGAFAEHGLREVISDEHFRFLMTAIRYNQIHAVVISAIGLALISDKKFANSSIFKWSGYLFIIGTVLFSFSIYFSVLFDIPNLVKVTPVGGMTIMAAWLLLSMAGFTRKKKRYSRCN